MPRFMRCIQYAAASRLKHLLSLEYWIARPSAQLRTKAGDVERAM